MLRETIQELLTILDRWDRRLRLQRSILWTPRGLIFGLGAGILLAAVARLRPFLMPEQVLLSSGIVLLVGLLTTLGVIWLRQSEALATARLFDDLFGMKERVSTALEMAAGGIQSPNEEITQRLVEDTLQRAGQINPAAYLPLRTRGRDWLIALALAAVLALLIVLPNPQNDVLAEQQIFDATLQEQVESLEDLREQISQNDALDEEIQREMMEALDETIEQLTREEMSQEEAFATLSDLAEEMQQIAEESAAADPEEQARQQALREALQQAAEAMQEGEDQPAAETGEALSESDIQRAQAGLESLAESVGEMSEAEQQALSEALEAAAQEIGEQDPALAESLQEAADALQEGDTEAAQEALEEAADQMGELAEQDATGSQSRQMASQAAQQAERSADEVARSGSQQQEGQEQEPGQQTGEQSGEGNTATRIQQAQPGEDGQSVESGQPGGENTDQPAAEGQSSSGQQTEGQTSSDGASTSAGAGDGEGGAQEGSFEAGEDQISQENDPTGDGLTDYEPVFAPQTIGEGPGEELQITGSGEPGDVVSQEGEFMESPEGESVVGYDEVFSDYANAANEALERDYIPLTLRDVIHDYFSALEP